VLTFPCRRIIFIRYDPSFCTLRPLREILYQRFLFYSFFLGKFATRSYKNVPSCFLEHVGVAVYRHFTFWSKLKNNNRQFTRRLVYIYAQVVVKHTLYTQYTVSINHAAFALIKQKWIITAGLILITFYLLCLILFRLFRAVYEIVSKVSIHELKI
jgi:hypothetical protein